MTQKEILEYNKRCAEFLGAKNLGKLGYSDSDYYEHELFERTEWSNKYQDYIDDNNMALYVMKFHSDWNWIMKVKTKIAGLYYKEFPIVTHIGSSGMYIGVNSSNALGNKYEGKKEIANTLNLNYGSVVEETKISLQEAVVQAINQFLIWYEQNK